MRHLGPRVFYSVGKDKVLFGGGRSRDGSDSEERSHEQRTAVLGGMCVTRYVKCSTLSRVVIFLDAPPKIR